MFEVFGLHPAFHRRRDGEVLLQLRQERRHPPLSLHPLVCCHHRRLRRRTDAISTRKYRNQTMDSGGFEPEASIIITDMTLVTFSSLKYNKVKFHQIARDGGYPNLTYPNHI